MAQEKIYQTDNLDQEKIFLTQDTTVSKSMRSAMTDVLTHNNPVGTIIGYYDDKLSILAVGSFFFANLGYT